MSPPSRGRWKAGDLAPSVKPDLPAAGASIVGAGGLLTAGLAASILTAAVFDRAGAFGPVDFNVFEGAFCDAFGVALAVFFGALFVGFLADSLALAGRVLARCVFADFPSCVRGGLREAAFRAAGFGDALGDFLRVFLD